MSSEEVHIIGILSENHLTESISLKELRQLLCDFVQVAPYYPVLLEVLAQNGEALQEKTKIDIHSIFKAIVSTYFTKHIPSYYGNRITKYTVKLIKAALITYTRGYLTMAEIRDGAQVHQMKEFETLSIGVPCNVQTVHSMLWIMKKTINNEILEKWINVHARFLEQPGQLMVNEFIYLLCNCVDKEEMLHKIPKIPMNVKMNKKTKLFHVDQEFPKTYESPDYKIQYMMAANSNVDKATIEGVSVSTPNNPTVVVKSNRKRLSKLEQMQEDQADSFRQQLRSMVMTVGIKVKLKEYHQKLIRSRLNGKSAYDKLVAQGEENLPSPLDLENPMRNKENNTSKTPKTPKRQTWVSAKRPQTASHRPMSVSYNSITPRPPTATAIKSPNHFNNFASSPMTTIRSPNNFASTSSSRMFGSPKNAQNALKETLNPNVSSTARKSKYSENVLKFQARLSSVELSGFPIKAIHTRKNSVASTNTSLASKDPDLIHAFESIVGEEYSIFEQKSQRVKPDRRSKSSSYFNSAFISPNATRIYSSKPGSPSVTLLSEKLHL